MKVLIVTPYRRCAGGVESVNRMLQSIFESDGHEVEYLTADEIAGSPGHLSLDVMKRVVGLPAVTAARYKHVRPAEFDLVLANGEFAWGIDHPNVVCVFHGSYLGLRNHLRAQLNPRQYASLSWQAQIQRFAARNKRVVAVSQFVAGILERQGIHVSGVIENCVDTRMFQPARRASALRYLFVGSYHRFAKGFDVLEHLASTGVDIDCVTDHAPGAGLRNLGTVAQEHMPEVYQSHRMLIFPSRFESFGLAPLEAMSCGLPVVMRDVGIGRSLKATLPEFVVSVPDRPRATTATLATAFAEHIEKIEARYEDFAAAARDYVTRNYSYERFASQWRALAHLPAAHPTPVPAPC